MQVYVLYSYAEDLLFPFAFLSRITLYKKEICILPKESNITSINAKLASMELRTDLYLSAAFL
jgi:hypothetical protein